MTIDEMFQMYKWRYLDVFYWTKHLTLGDISLLHDYIKTKDDKYAFHWEEDETDFLKEQVWHYFALAITHGCEQETEKMRGLGGYYEMGG